MNCFFNFILVLEGRRITVEGVSSEGEAQLQDFVLIYEDGELINATIISFSLSCAIPLCDLAMRFG